MLPREERNPRDKGTNLQKQKTTRTEARACEALTVNFMILMFLVSMACSISHRFPDCAGLELGALPDEETSFLGTSALERVGQLGGANFIQFQNKNNLHKRHLKRSLMLLVSIVYLCISKIMASMQRIGKCQMLEGFPLEATQKQHMSFMKPLLVGDGTHSLRKATLFCKLSDP